MRIAVIQDISQAVLSWELVGGSDDGLGMTVEVSTAQE
jgi:hypothetical protein